MQQSLCRSICTVYTHTGMRIHKRTHARCTHTLPYVFMSLFGKRTEMLPRAHTLAHSLCTECEHRARGYKCLYFFVALKSKVNLTHRTSKQASKQAYVPLLFLRIKNYFGLPILCVCSGSINVLSARKSYMFGMKCTIYFVRVKWTV